MQAAIVHRYGGPEVVTVAERDQPTPRAGQVLIQVAATAVTAGDQRMRSGVFPRGFAIPGKLAIGIRGPRKQVLGNSAAGVVVAVGEQVTDFKLGQGVCGMAGFNMGCHAEFALLSATKTVPIPKAVTFEQAAAVMFGGTTAYHFLHTLGQVKVGDEVLVIGAAGDVGRIACQLALSVGARVTAVAHASNIESLRDLGITQVIAYDQRNWQQDAACYDFIFDTSGEVRAKAAKQNLNPDGKLLWPVADLLTTALPSKTVVTGTAAEKAEVVANLLNRLASGDLQVPISAVYPLTAAADAHEALQQPHRWGTVLLRPV